MKTVFAVVLTLLVSSELLAIPFPLEAEWDIAIQDSATCLGPNWAEGGSPRLLVGAGRKALIFGQGELLWSSVELPGAITALYRVDFGLGDGQEVIAAFATDSTAGIVELKGDALDDTTVYELLQNERVADGDDTVFNYNIPITAITSFTDQGADSSKSVIIFNDAARFYLYGDNAGSEWGRIFKLSLASGEFVLRGDYGRVSKVLKADWDGDGSEELILYGYSTFQEWIMQFDITRILSVMNHHLQVLWRWESPLNYFYMFPNCRAPLTALPSLGDTCRIIVGYDSGLTDTLITNLNSFQSGQITPNAEYLFSGGNLSDLGVVRGVEGEDWLLMIYNSSAVRAALLNNLYAGQVYDRIEQDERVVGGYRFDDFDGDGRTELAYLTEDRLHYARVGSLNVPISEEHYEPQTADIGVSPNPFNHHTSIKYTIHERGVARVSAYDVSGRLVQELWRGDRCPGEYSILWQAPAAGVYLIQVEMVCGVRRVVKGVCLP